MASSYTGLGTELMTTGENAGTWGTTTNTNLQILEQISGGYVEQSVTSTPTTLSVSDGSTGATLGHRVIKFTGTISANTTVTVPLDVQQMYILVNGTAGAYTLTFKYVTGSGSTVTWAATDKGTKLVYAAADHATNPNMVDSGIGSTAGHDLDGNELILDADADTSITADTDDQIDIRIAGADDFQFTANTFTAQAGSTIAAQALTATTVTASGIIKTDDTTEATSTTDGSLQTDGGLSVAKDAVIGDDLKLLSDSAVLSFGADSDVSLTHVADTALLLNAAMRLQFRDSGLYIGSNADGDLDVVSDGTAVDSINLESAGGITLDAGTAGSGIVYEDDGTEMARIYNSSSDVILETKVSDKDFSIKGNDGGSAITALSLDMSAAGAATFNDKVIATELDISGDMDIDGTANLDNTDIDGTFAVDGTTISLDATTSLNIDNSNTSNGITLGTATSGVPISIGHTTSETTVNDNLTVTGDLTVNGTTTTVNSTTVTIDDPIFTLGGDTAPGSDDNKDRGIEFRYHDGSSARIGFFGYDDSATGFTFLTAATNSSEVFSGTAAKIIAGELDISGNMDIDGTSNLDAVDIDGAVQIDAAVTVGEDDTGYDVKFFGATSGAYMLWDESTDDLILAGAAKLYLYDAGGGEYLSSSGSALTIASGSAAWELPAADGSANQVLKTDGSGNLDWTSVSSAADDISAGDAAVTITTTSGNITIDAQENDSDIIFKGTDGNADTTFLTIDGSDGGTATFNHDIKVADDGQVGSASAADAMIISSGGIVTFKDDILIKDGGTIGVASVADAMTISSGGIVTFKDDIVIKDGGTIGVDSDADSITIASNGAVTFSQAPVFPDGSIAVADLDIDGATDIGEAIVDADLFIVDNGAGGTNRKVAASRLVTYIDANSSAATVGKAIAMAIVFG